MKLSELLNIDDEIVIKSEYIIKQIQTDKKTQIQLPLGLKIFDKSILNGGFIPKKKYLIFGANNTGKTQILHQICVQAYKTYHEQFEYLKEKNVKFIYYLDTENTFRPERIKEIALQFSFDYNHILKSINVSKIMSNDALLLKLKEIDRNELIENVRVILIDTINNHYRSEQGNKDISFFKTKNTFLKTLELLDKFVKNYNLVIIATAQVIPNFVENTAIKEIPVGNQFISHYFSEFLYLENKDEKNFIHLVNSHYFPEKKSFFKIASEGIKDYQI